MKNSTNTFMRLTKLFCAVMVLSACGGGDSSESPEIIIKDNNAPIADAGIDQIVDTGSTVILNGSGSTDPDSDTLTYAWTLNSRPAGSLTMLSDLDSVETTFVADLDGTYNISLVVNDGSLNSTQDLIVVRANSTNSAPVANSGLDQSVATGTLVVLNATDSSDPDSDTLTYAWTLDSKPVGSAATLSDADTVQATFVADLDGAYIVSLVVDDGIVSSAPDSVVVTASSTNSAPVANAGLDQTVVTGTQVILNGNNSSDPNGDSLSYVWTLDSRPAGSTAILSDTSSAQATFFADLDGTYNASLVVSDGSLDSVSDSILITASSTNAAPLADAGIDMNVDTGSQVILNGSGSSDPDGDTISYAWTLESKPTGSTAILTNATTSQATYTADLDGLYNASLVVNDGSVNSTPDSIVVTATTTNNNIPSRLPSPIDLKLIHSGHSLTDNAVSKGTWPGHMYAIWNEIDNTNTYYDNLIAKRTSPGSPLSVRWSVSDTPDARNNINDYELLVITEGVPLKKWFWNGTDPGSAWYTDNLTHMRLFVENAWNNGDSGNGATTLLYATWGELDDPDTATWRADLDTDKPFWEQMADYGAANLPSEAFVFIVPGNLLMMRLYDDIQAGQQPAGISNINDYFADDIHPNGLGQYALAILHLAVIHHINPNTLPDPDYGLTPQPTTAQADYLKSIVWEIVTNYDHTGVPSN